MMLFVSALVGWGFVHLVGTILPFEDSSASRVRFAMISLFLLDLAQPETLVHHQLFGQVSSLSSESVCHFADGCPQRVVPRTYFPSNEYVELLHDLIFLLLKNLAL